MGTPRSRSRALACALAISLLVLGACGGGDDSVADPPVSSSPSSSSPTTAPHRESPAHFIRRWANAEKHMENTGEATEYLALSRGCGPCRKLAARVDSYYKAGGYVRWGGWRIISVKHYAGGQTLQFAVHSNSRPTKYRASSSSPVQRFSGGSITYVLALKRANHSWVVTNKSELES